jgi:LPS-assembly protein
MRGAIRHISPVLVAICLWLGTVAAGYAQQQASDSAAAAAPAQPAMLVADRVYVTPDRRLVAEGNVEAFQGDTRVRATRITFDKASGTLKIEGPIRIEQEAGVIVLADAAEMDDGLRNGILSGARIVMDQQLQLAAVQMNRVGGRYSQLYKTVVTSCHVCENGKPPLWQIRARRVIHDQQERQLYFEDAQLRVFDVPIFYTPFMRLPDPTLDRANGFLIPSVRTTSQLGTGLKVPYFFRLGDHADLTLAPYVSSKTLTLDYSYRQAFRRGRVEFDGAFTKDDLIPDQTRGYLFGDGYFNFENAFRLEFDIQTSSDKAYLIDYGLGDYDRLRSQIKLTRTKRDQFFGLSLINFRTLRDGENESTLPTLVGDAVWDRRYHPAAIGGEVRVGIETHGHYRTSSLDVLGRDIVRATAHASWLRSHIFANGLRTDWRMGMAADMFDIFEDSNYPDQVGRLTPDAALRFSYPMTRTTARGGIHTLEPIMQVGWTDVIGDPVPNDESRFVEFDKGNLLSLSRFPAYDRREDGATLVYGLNWSREGAGNWRAFATVGQVFRPTANPDFSTTSGLSGTSSDFLLAGQVQLDRGLTVTARTLLDDAFSFSKAEFRGDWDSKRARFSASYMWLGQDLAEDRPDRLSEIWFDGDYDVTRNWTAGANLRYDLSDERAINAGVGLIYRNECVEVDLSLNRRYTSSSSIEPSTTFGFTIALHGFSVASDKEGYSRKCSKS